MRCVGVGGGMKRGKSTGKPTKAEASRMAEIKAMTCIACEIGNAVYRFSQVEVHHIVDKGYRKHSGGHMATLPLCSFHHRGEPPYNWTVSEATEMFGPSFALQKRKFVAKYGTERELLAIIDKRLQRTS
jgi:hypothetical protein